MGSEAWTSLLAGLLIVGLSAVLMWSHARTWRRVGRRAERDPREFDYRRRQFRRRMQSSAMLGLVGGAIAASHFVAVLAERFIEPPMSGVAVLIYWVIVMVLVIWIALLAMADMVSTRLYFGRLQRSYRSEKSRLEADLRRVTRLRGNGKAEQRAKGDPGQAGDGPRPGH